MPISAVTPGQKVLQLPLHVDNTLSAIAPADPLYDGAQKVAKFVRDSKAASTRRAYASDWAHFDEWCRRAGLSSLPAQESTVALYIAELASPKDRDTAPLRPQTIRRRLTTINLIHGAKQLPSPARMTSPLVSSTFQGIKRLLGTRQKGKTPIQTSGILKILDEPEGPVAAARNKALVLVGFSAALRRSELVAIEVKHLTWSTSGVTILVPRSKTDQAGEGREVEVSYGANRNTCPVHALDNWLKVANITSGAVFRKVSRNGTIGKSPLRPEAVGDIVKRLAVKARLGPAEDFAGHSLRAGFVTVASNNGSSHADIAKQTGHKSLATVQRYSRADQMVRRATASNLGL